MEHAAVPSEVFSDDDWCRHLMSCIHRLQYGNVKCDACLLGTDGGMTMVHGIIMAAASPVLSSRLWGSASSPPVMIDIEAKSETIKKVVEFVYSGQVTTANFCTWDALLDLARRLEIDSLLRLCSQHVDDACLGQMMDGRKKNSSSVSASTFPYFEKNPGLMSPSSSNPPELDLQVTSSPMSSDRENQNQNQNCKVEEDCFEGVTTLPGRMMPATSEAIYTEMKTKEMSSPMMAIPPRDQTMSEPTSMASRSSEEGDGGDSRQQQQQQVPQQQQQQELAVPTTSSIPLKIARQKEGFIGDCPDCGLLLGSPEAARLHQNVHSGLKAYSCEICKKQFDTKRSHTLHLRNVHHEGSSSIGGIGFSCTICGKVLASRLGLKVHEETHAPIRRKYVCTICSKVLTTPLGLKNHELNHRSIKESFTCSICGKVLTTKLGLKLHEINHSGVKQLFFCQYCNKKLTTKLGLQLHEESHRNTGNRHRCHICSQVMASESTLRTHLASHSNDAPGTYECNVCKKMLTSRANLQAHEQMHSEGKMLYQCNFCNKVLSTKSGLKLHEDLHWRPDKAQYPCPVCDMVFTTRAACELHHMEHIRQANEISRALGNDPI